MPDGNWKNIKHTTMVIEKKIYTLYIYINNFKNIIVNICIYIYIYIFIDVLYILLYITIVICLMFS